MIMFNLAKKKREKTPADQTAELVHKKKLGNREQNIDLDAKRMGLFVAESGGMKSVLDIMQNDPYWDYVLSFDKKYAEEVIKKAEHHYAPQAEEEGANPSPSATLVPQSLPPKQKKPPMGSMGASDKEIKTAEQVVFLKRDKKRYMLFGTLVSRILSGWQEYLDEEGKPRVLRIKSRDASVSRSGPAAKIALRIQDEMPAAVRRTAAEFLRPHAPEDADNLARAICLSAWRKHKFDFIQVSMAIDGVPVGFLLKEGVPGIEEPAPVQELRKAMGRVMHPYIKGLTSALQMEGVAVEEGPSSAPSYSSIAQEQMEHQPKVHRPAEPDVIPDQRGEQHQAGEPRLEQVGIDGQPGLFRGEGLSERLCGDCFHDCGRPATPDGRASGVNRARAPGAVDKSVTR